MLIISQVVFKLPMKGELGLAILLMFLLGKKIISRSRMHMCMMQALVLYRCCGPLLYASNLMPATTILSGLTGMAYGLLISTIATSEVAAMQV